MNAPKLFQDEFSITRGNATFRLIWSGDLSAEDKQDIFEWLTLIERRIRRLHESTPVAQPANTDSVPGSPASKVTRPSEQDAPGSSIVLGAEGEQ